MFFLVSGLVGSICTGGTAHQVWECCVLGRHRSRAVVVVCLYSCGVCVR